VTPTMTKETVAQGVLRTLRHERRSLLFRRISRNQLLVFGAVIFVLMLLAAVVANIHDAEILPSVPTESVVIFVAIGGSQRSPHQVTRRVSDEPIIEHGHFELSHIIGGGEPTAAGDLVAGVEEIGVRYRPGFIFAVEPSAERNNCKTVVDHRMRHACGRQHILTDVIHITLSRSALDSATHQREPLSRIVEFGARLGNEWIVLEEIDPALDWVREVLRVAVLGIVLRSGLVIANSAQVA